MFLVAINVFYILGFTIDILVKQRFFAQFCNSIPNLAFYGNHAGDVTGKTKTVNKNYQNVSFMTIRYAHFNTSLYINAGQSVEKAESHQDRKSTVTSLKRRNLVWVIYINGKCIFKSFYFKWTAFYAF